MVLLFQNFPISDLDADESLVDDDPVSLDVAPPVSELSQVGLRYGTWFSGLTRPALGQQINNH